MDSPSRFGRYEVLEPLGRGAMGAVYKARDPLIDRIVAVKTMGRAILAFPEHHEEFLARFQQEARAAGRLSHPHIVSVYDVGFDDETRTPFLVMEYVPGVSLATLLHENPVMPVAQAVEIIEQIGSALDEAHSHGIVHRDIKPGNVFLDTRGRVKVGDFGIARIDGSELTRTGVGLGTPGYLAPEVLRGAKADPQSDLFALAVVAYALLAGQKPFAGDTTEAVGLQVLQHDPPPPHAVRPEVPRVVSEAVMRALAKDPERRTPNVAWFLAELRGTREPATAALATAPTHAPPAARRAFVVAGLVTAAAVLLGGALLALKYFGGAAEDPALAVTPAARPAPTRPSAAAARPAPPRDQGDGEDRKDGDEEHKKDAGHGKGKGKKKGH